jgi:hypothetical protein
VPHAAADNWIERQELAGERRRDPRKATTVARDKEEKMLREALIRQRAAEIMELALSDPLYGVSREEAIKRAAARVGEKYGRPKSEKKGGKK